MQPPKGPNPGWIAPQLVTLTTRHAVFVGLRDDKPADAISLENDSELD